MWKFDNYRTNRWAKGETRGMSRRAMFEPQSRFGNWADDALNFLIGANTPVSYAPGTTHLNEAGTEFVAVPPVAPVNGTQAMNAFHAIATYGTGDTRTRQAVKIWQASHGGLKVDGIYGPASAAALRLELGPTAPVAYFTR